MNKRNNFIKAAAVLLMAGTLLGGCVGMDQENKNLLELSADGKITQEIVDDISNDVTGEELENYTNEHIQEAQSAGASISLENCRVKNGKINLRLNYDGTGSYTTFNGVACFNGTVKEAYEAGYDFDRTFTAKNGVEVPYFTLVSLCTDCKVFIVEEPVTVELPGELVYMSEGVTVEGDGTITVDENPDESLPEAFQTTTIEPVFMIYKD